MWIKTLCCCCTESRKNSTINDDLTTKAVPRERLAELGLKESNNKEESELLDQNVDEKNENDIVTTIRQVALALIKKAIVSIIQSRIENKVPNSDFPLALGKELVCVESYAQYLELSKVIMKGPTNENKLVAEQIAMNLAQDIIAKAELNVPMTYDEAPIDNADIVEKFEESPESSKEKDDVVEQIENQHED